ncbi:hypothetical protein [Clostridium paridis]|uniref:Uncharacterized protein n=1 Tax=Clostridium paridis TaxID=2803863 RepID=A0A937FEW0_9CLOT|nr:hypothetical protein [Clostridium paridis]MBL4931615.1 hypothetical protein [Clostridium paridis]
MKTKDEVYVKLEELKAKFQYEIEIAGNSINENVITIGKKIDEIINQYYNIRKNASANRE